MTDYTELLDVADSSAEQVLWLVRTTDGDTLGIFDSPQDAVVAAYAPQGYMPTVIQVYLCGRPGSGLRVDYDEVYAGAFGGPDE